MANICHTCHEQLTVQAARLHACTYEDHDLEFDPVLVEQERRDWLERADHVADRALAELRGSTHVSA